MPRQISPAQRRKLSKGLGVPLAKLTTSGEHTSQLKKKVYPRRNVEE
jgi:hypothetical protein